MPTKQSLSIALLTISKLFCFFTFRYLSCVSQTMKKLQPFGDVPKKLTEQLRRSFVASRTFAQALLEGKQIVNKISKVSYGNFFQLFFCAAKSFPFVLLGQIRPPVLWQDAKPPLVWSLDMFFAMWISFGKSRYHHAVRSFTLFCVAN